MELLFLLSRLQRAEKVTGGKSQIVLPLNSSDLRVAADQTGRSQGAESALDRGCAHRPGLTLTQQPPPPHHKTCQMKQKGLECVQQNPPPPARPTSSAASLRT